VGLDQLDKVWRRYVQTATVLHLRSLPDLYVYNRAEVNAMTLGANRPIVVMNASLVSGYSIDEAQTVTDDPPSAGQKVLVLGL